MKKQTLLTTLSLILLLVAGCAPKTVTPDPNMVIQQAVAATLAAMPTQTSVPPFTPYPTPTAFNLAGLFCEYQFCIGHPVDVVFFDISAQKNPAATSTYSQGMLAAFNNNLFIQVMWQIAPNTSDPRFLMDTLLDDQLDTAAGNMDIFLIRDMNVMYDNISTTAAAVLPAGGIGAWTCGDRVFAWKVYAPSVESARPLFDEALARFTCGQ
ncbi:MAG: hypothetical protein KJZ72_18375 [Anaerolineales bacterium]|nr:hypothetical protein [Anaerolineales bacterium]